MSNSSTTNRILSLLFLLLMIAPPASTKAQNVVTVTMYYAAKGRQTADGTVVKNPTTQRICAVSPDLLAKYPYGSRIYVEGFGTYIVHDRTARRMRKVVDLLIPRSKKAFSKPNVKIRKR